MEVHSSDNRPLTFIYLLFFRVFWNVLLLLEYRLVYFSFNIQNKSFERPIERDKFKVNFQITSEFFTYNHAPLLENGTTVTKSTAIIAILALRSGKNIPVTMKTEILKTLLLVLKLNKQK